MTITNYTAKWISIVCCITLWQSQICLRLFLHVHGLMPPENNWTNFNCFPTDVLAQLLIPAVTLSKWYMQVLVRHNLQQNSQLISLKWWNRKQQHFHRYISLRATCMQQTLKLATCPRRIQRKLLTHTYMSAKLICIVTIMHKHYFTAK